MQFGYINGIIYHQIDTFLSLAIFKCSMPQKQDQSLFRVKDYEKIFTKYFRPRSTWGDALRREKDNFILLRRVYR